MIRAVLIVMGLFMAISETVTGQEFELPGILLMGDHAEEFSLVKSRSISLLEVCGANLEIAYSKWMHMVEEMDLEAAKQNFDLKGVKIWLNVIWNQDGSIQHLAFFLKPGSRQIDISGLNDFLAYFKGTYRMPIQSAGDFTHYGSAAFPASSGRFVRVDN